MDQKLIFITLLGMGFVTYLPRLLPTLFLSGRKLPSLITTWLSLVPPAVLAAMLLPSLVVRQEELSFSFDNLFLWAAVLVFPVAVKAKSLALTVLLGMALVAGGRYFGIGS